MVQGGQSLVKYLLFFFNFLFVVTGIILISVGGVFLSNVKGYAQYLGPQSSSTAIFIIVVGVIIFGIAFLGCCGAVKENYCMVMTFAVLLFIIFVMEFAAGIAAYVYKNKIHDLLDENMKQEVHDYNGTSKDREWDDMQKNLKCCGSSSPLDWHTSNNTLFQNGTFPDSCCMDVHPGFCLNDTTSPVYEKGCLFALEDYIVNNIAVIGGVGIGIAFVEVVGIIFACCLARAIKKEYEVV